MPRQRLLKTQQRTMTKTGRKQVRMSCADRVFNVFWRSHWRIDRIVCLVKATGANAVPALHICRLVVHPSTELAACASCNKRALQRHVAQNVQIQIAQQARPGTWQRWRPACPACQPALSAATAAAGTATATGTSATAVTAAMATAFIAPSRPATHMPTVRASNLQSCYIAF